MADRLKQMMLAQMARTWLEANPGLSVDEVERKVRAAYAADPDRRDPETVEELIRQLRDPQIGKSKASIGAIFGEALKTFFWPGDARELTQWKRLWQSPSAVALIAANLLPLYGVAFLGWPVIALLLLYWIENVVLGVLNALRMLCINASDPAQWGAKLAMVPFFCFHYGLFTWFHGGFVFTIFGGDRGKAFDYWPDAVLRVINENGLWLTVSALAASHLFSFFWNFLYRGEFRVLTLQAQTMKPYTRVLVLHVALIFGGIVALVIGAPAALLVLVVLKIGLDLKAHLKEHREAQAGGAQPASAS
ncbi:MAG: DUF6498-containing protein [Burkholderiales bacterium]